MESLSRRQQVAWEKLKAQLIYSQIDPTQSPQAASERVTFRHLALLAQIRSEDKGVWESLQRSQLISEPGEDLVRRLQMMRTWIGGPNFPESFRLRIQTSIAEQAKSHLDMRDRDYLSSVKTELSSCPWEADQINAVICNTAKIRDISLRDAFQLLYWIVLDQDFGPKLANIVAEMSRDDVLNLLQSAIDVLSP